MTPVYAFACRTEGAPEWGETIRNAVSAGAAKADHWRHVSDAWEDVPFTAMRARKIGEAHTSEDFIRNAKYRGMPDVRCGQPVKVGDETGIIVGHNASANFDVLFERGKYAGQTLNVHPASIELLPHHQESVG